ncbi:MAG: hypothetical protein IH986_04105 [Planctomycetes bacterium]|nr:hypothetical protein [Planctomycetota bacterium]
MSRDTMKRLADPNLLALYIDGDAWPRALMSSTPIPDAWMSLVERRDGRRRFVPAGEDPKPEKDERIVLVRNRLITLPVGVSETKASCGNIVSGGGEVLVRWQARDDDLAALRKSVMTQEELTLERLTKLFADAGGRTALENLIRANPARKLVHEEVRADLLAALSDQLKRFLFETGLIIDRVGRLKLTSDTLAHTEALQRDAERRVERIKARQTVERAAITATERRLEGLSAVFEKLKSAAGDESRLQWHDLLPSLSPAERGRLLENLWRITPDHKTARAVVLVAGNECVWLDPTNPEHLTRRVPLDEDLGGLRSVTFSRACDRLLVGAARGVWLLSPDDGKVLARLEVPTAERPRTGFNAATIVGGRVCATHSQLGCWSWSLENPSDCVALLTPQANVPRTVRAATATDDGRLVFAADDSVRIFDAAGQQLESRSTNGATVHCLDILEDSIYVGTGDGLVLQGKLDGGDWVVAHRGSDPIESIDARRWNDLVELVIPAGPQGVCGVYGDEGIISPLMRGPASIRRAWACDDAIVGLSERRDRLIVLHADMPEKQGVEVPVARMLGHTVQDACIVVAASEPEAATEPNAASEREAQARVSASDAVANDERKTT